MKNFIKLIFTALLLCPAVGYCADNYVVGTYNVRIATDTDGEKIWADRKTYVARTILDNEFDVVGLNEVLDGVQRADLESLLDGYDTEFRLVYSGSTKKQMNGVAWLKCKFDMLDSGMFYLSPDVTSSSIRFPGATQSKGTVWVKLRDKATDDILYFFSCHLYGSGQSEAQKESSRLHVDQVRAIAGNHPVIFAGDLNSLSVTTHVAGIMKSYLKSVNDICTAPVDSPMVTVNHWDPDPLNKYQCDYVYVRHFDVSRCETVTETYGRGITPSDHSPLVITCHLNASGHCQKVYVDCRNSDAGDGSKDNPYASLEKAVSMIASGDTIFMTQGLYEAPETSFHFTESATLIGGYDSEFDTVGGRSVLVAPSSGGRVITIDSPFYLEISNCDIIGGDAGAQNGGGILCNGTMLKLENVDMYDNRATDGGAISMVGDLMMSDCMIHDNYAVNTGGALHVYSGNTWKHEVTRCEFIGNKSVLGAAVYAVGGIRGLWNCNSFYDNESGSGDVIHIANQELSSTITMVNNTIARNGGGISAILTTNGSLNLVNNTIVGNLSDGKGAVVLSSGKLGVHNNIIAANTPSDIWLEGTLSGSSYNIYSFPSSINFTPKKNDILAADEAKAISSVVDMLGGEYGGDRYIPVLEKCSGHPSHISVKTPVFCGKVVNSLPYRQLNEYVTNTDLDNDFRITTFTYLLEDQISIKRPVDGTATIGAVEYVQSSSTIGNVGYDRRVVIECDASSNLMISTTEILEDCRLISAGGNVVRFIGDVHSGVSSIDLSSIPAGVYVLVWGAGSRKIFVW